MHTQIALGVKWSTVLCSEGHVEQRIKKEKKKKKSNTRENDATEKINTAFVALSIY